MEVEEVWECVAGYLLSPHLLRLHLWLSLYFLHLSEGESKYLDWIDLKCCLTDKPVRPSSPSAQIYWPISSGRVNTQNHDLRVRRGETGKSSCNARDKVAHLYTGRYKLCKATKRTGSVVMGQEEEKEQKEFCACTWGIDSQQIKPRRENC